MLSWTLTHNICNDALLDFGNLLEYASILHKTEKYNVTLKGNIFSNILELIASDDLLKSLLGHRILQHLMDRHENKSQFESAR